MGRKARGDENDASRLIEAMGDRDPKKHSDNRLTVFIWAVIVGLVIANVALWVTFWPWVVATLTGGLTGAE